MARFYFLCALISIGWLSVVHLNGCDRRNGQQVTLYTSIDEPIARPIIRQFEARTGILVRLVTDSEATKSVGLAERVRAERASPGGDVWWGNEPFHTINLASEGLLAPYESPAAADIPAQFKDAAHHWAGSGLRARVFIARPGAFGTKPVDSLKRLTDPDMKGRITLARPTAGTTGGHVAALYVLWGDSAADQFFKALRANEAKLLGGNGVVAQAVAVGTMDIGLTDNDDVAAVRAEGHTVDQILPDQTSEGTLLLPTTVALIAGRPESPAARQLADFLLSAEAERLLLAAKFSLGSVRGEVSVKGMQVDYTAVARKLPEAVRRATAILDGREE